MTDHLTEDARVALELDDRARCRLIREERWVQYSRAERTLSELEDLLNHPPKSRMPNLLIVGDTNNGKSMILNRFADAHPPSENADGPYISAPVFKLQAPARPDIDRFFCEILDRIFAPYKHSDKTSKKELQAIGLLKRIGTKVLIIDEINNLTAGNATNQRVFLNTLKNLSNELRIPLVGAGTREALSVIQSDRQLANRFRPSIIPRWRNDLDFARLLMTLVSSYPLKKPTEIANANLRGKILAKSEGTIGEIVDLVESAAIYAISTGTERITQALLNDIEWHSPSERKRAYEASVSA